MKQKRKCFLMTLMITVSVLANHLMGVRAASNDIVDASKTGSITIRKYDMTTADAKGIDFDKYTSTGKQDPFVEEL